MLHAHALTGPMYIVFCFAIVLLFAYPRSVVPLPSLPVFGWAPTSFQVRSGRNTRLFNPDFWKFPFLELVQKRSIFLQVENQHVVHASHR